MTTRRDCLKTLLNVALTAITYSRFFDKSYNANANNGLLPIDLLNSEYNFSERSIFGNIDEIYLLDQNSNKTESMRTDLKRIHGFVQLGDNKIIVLEKFGDRAAIVQIAPFKILRYISASPGHFFYGHGVFSKSNNRLYTVEATFQAYTKEGIVVERDPKTLEPLASIPSGGYLPHDIAIHTKKNILVVTNSMGLERTHGNVAAIDLNDKKLLYSIKLPHPYLIPNHITTVGNTGIVAISTLQLNPKDKAAFAQAIAFKPKSIQDFLAFNDKLLNSARFTNSRTYFINNDWKLETFQENEEKKILAVRGFSIKFNPHNGLLAVTYGETKSVFIFDSSNNKLVQTVKLPVPPSSISIHQKNFLIGCAGGNVYQISRDSTGATLFAKEIHSQHALNILSNA